MRIQHNIMAMNAYRNYSNNTKSLSKNLEKLSSGYKINRAGDDAAGLAISEKMRAQITGLEAAQKNVKDGISLVNTAEGALQEVQDMMNRMVYLAQESANGTFDNPVDRKALQDEVNQLRDEINRIADSANFNGIKLLDGSLGGGTSVGKGSTVSLVAPKLSGKAEDAGAIKDGTAAAATSVAVFNAIAANDITLGDVVSVNLKLSDGTEYSFEMKYVDVDGTKAKFVSLDGKETYGETAANNAATASEVHTAFAAAMNKNSDLKSKVTITGSATDITFAAKVEGFAGPTVESASVVTSGSGKAASAPKVTVTTEGKGDHKVLDATKLLVYKSGGGGTFTKDVDEAIFTIEGKRFALVNNIETDASAFDKDVTLIETGASAAVASDVKDLIGAINKETGLNLKADTGTATDILLYSKASGTAGAGGLTLQIGDSSDSYNQLNVSVKDMHTYAMGIAHIDIGTQAGAQAAVDVIKNAINYVSSVRGTLGAISNRLDHTYNNLGVMRENIQDAESAIRDVDVADEMMAYTKNNILVQSAQAMLAQANQVPQGVLQLLQ